MKRTVKYWCDGQLLPYRKAKKHPSFDRRFYTVEYKETWKERKNRVIPKVMFNLIFWGVEIGMFVLAMYILFRYCL